MQPGAAWRARPTRINWPLVVATITLVVALVAAFSR
jgi:hypothetical protein